MNETILETLQRHPSYFNPAEDLVEYPNLVDLLCIVLDRIADDKDSLE